MTRYQSAYKFRRRRFNRLAVVGMGRGALNLYKDRHEGLICVLLLVGTERTQRSTTRCGLGSGGREDAITRARRLWFAGLGCPGRDLARAGVAARPTWGCIGNRGDDGKDKMAVEQSRRTLER